MTYSGAYYQSSDIFASTSTAGMSLVNYVTFEPPFANDISPIIGADYYTSQPLAAHHGASYTDIYGTVSLAQLYAALLCWRPCSLKTESKPIIRRTPPDALYSSMDYRSTQPPTLYASYQQPPQPQQPSAMPDSFEDVYNNNGTGALVRATIRTKGCYCSLWLTKIYFHADLLTATVTVARLATWRRTQLYYRNGTHTSTNTQSLRSTFTFGQSPQSCM